MVITKVTVASDDLATHWAVLFSTKLALCEICEVVLTCALCIGRCSFCRICADSYQLTLVRSRFPCKSSQQGVILDDIEETSTDVFLPFICGQEVRLQILGGVAHSCDCKQDLVKNRYLPKSRVTNVFVLLQLIKILNPRFLFLLVLSGLHLLPFLPLMLHLYSMLLVRSFFF